MIDLFILAACNVANLALGLIILLRNPARLANRVFAFLSLAIVLWTTFNFLADTVPADLTLLFTRLTFIGGVLIGLALVYLGRFFPNENVLKTTWLNKIQPSIAIIVSVLSMSPWIVEAAHPGKAGAGAELTTGPLYAVYLIYVLQVLLVLIYNLRVQIKRAYSGLQKNQVRLILIGLLIYCVFAIGSNLIIPLIIDTWTSSRFGPIFSLVLVAITGYTIVRHRLFDIKLAITRSIAYLFSLAMLAFIYVIFIFGLANYVFDINLSFFVQVVLSIVTAVVALSSYRLKRIFDRFTSKLFFRDAYDSQDFFNAFNKILVTSTQLSTLLDSTSKVIMEYLKARSCFVYVNGNGSKSYRTGGIEPDSSKLKHIEKILLELKNPTTVVDELATENAKLAQTLRKCDVAIIVKLGIVSNSTQEDMGYILVGAKKSGNLYNKQDINVVEAAANELVIAIQNTLRFDQIQEFNNTLQQRIEDATKKLRASNTQLQKLDEAKDEFVSMASHQLRTPLTSVKGYLSMVLEGDAGKITASQRKLLGEAFTSSERMVHLIGDFLNVSRLQTGKFILEQKPVDLAKVVEQEVSSLQTTAHAHDLKLQYRAPSYFPILYLDEGKIRQVLMNFMDNAIYYSQGGTAIVVTLAVKEGDVVLEVKDTGIGVPKAEQAHLFTKFFRATNARKQRPDGTGVGLFLAKKVIDAHEGTMVFESTEGEGSTFGFRLPVKKLSTAPADDTHKLDK